MKDEIKLLAKLAAIITCGVDAAGRGISTPDAVATAAAIINEAKRYDLVGKQELLDKVR